MSPQPPIALTIRFPAASREAFVEGYWRGVMDGGMFVSTIGTPELTLGVEVHFRFQLEDGSEILAGSGVVAWVCRRPGYEPGVGLRFTELTRQSEQLHRQMLARKSREVRRGLAANQRKARARVQTREFLEHSPTKPVPAQTRARVREDLTNPVIKRSRKASPPPMPGAKSGLWRGDITAKRIVLPEEADSGLLRV